MKLFITGINGFIGGSLANHYVKQGHDICGIGRQDKLASFVSKDCKYIKGDISQTPPNISADVIIHCAALASDKASYEMLYLNNVRGTDNIIEASQDAGHFIYISSSSVYSFNERPMRENEAGAEMNLLSNYGKTKLLGEQLVLSKSKVYSKYILRPRAVYGINDRLLLPRLLKLVKGKKLILPAHTTSNISLTHISNLIQAVQLCINSKSGNSKTYNVSDAHPYALAEVLTPLLKAITQTDLKVIKIPTAVWEGLIKLNEWIGFNNNLTRFGSEQFTKRAILDIEAIKNEMNYCPEKNMLDSYDEISNWIKQLGGWEKYMQRNEHFNP